MSRSAAPATTSSYGLSAGASAAPASLGASLRRLAPFIWAERRDVALALVAGVTSSISALVAPYLIGRAIDTHVRNGDFPGVVRISAAVLAVYLVGLVTMYVQTRVMGTVGRRVLFALRNDLFAKLQELPLDFFQQNKAGDLISRVNNDTDKLNQFFAQGFLQLVNNLVMMSGAAVFLLGLHPRLGTAALLPAAAVLALTRVLSPWVKGTNVRSLSALGGLSADIQESLSHFKVIVAFNRRDYFRRRFEEANERHYAASTRSGLSSALFSPIYTLAYNVAQVAVLVYGLGLAMQGAATVGLLVSFLLYVNSFYLPMRQFAVVWTTFQLALAGFDRVSAVLALRSNLPVVSEPAATSGGPLLVFDDVSFHYANGPDVLRRVSFALERGRTYAFVGPTGGGKTTTASLMARLYDPTAGRVLFDGRDVRSLRPDERARSIGFILQEPFLFTGTVRENVLYGNPLHAGRSPEAADALLEARGLTALFTRFPQGLETRIVSGSESLSLGEKQIVAFVRAVLREPDLLILDEATANVDTATEQVLQAILDGLPPTTTRVVVAHRLTTIANADEIFFVNAPMVTPAGSMEHAVEMLLHGKRAS